MMKTIVHFLLFFVFSFNAYANEKPYVVSTTAQIGDVIRNIGGDRISVDYIMGSGVDPHLYQPTRSDMSKFMRADLVFYNGLKLEGRMDELFHDLQNTKSTIAIADFIPKHMIHQMNGGAYEYDPHIWMDVKIWIEASKIIESELCKFSQQSCDYFKNNAEMYRKELTDLDSQIKKSFEAIPPSQKVLVTAHDAFGYLSKAYDIEVIGIQGVSTQSEAGMGRISELVKILCDRKIPSVFIETSVGDQNIKAIIEGARARGHNVQIGGALYSDAMGAEGTTESTYIGMMKYNTRIISESLSKKGG